MMDSWDDGWRSLCQFPLDLLRKGHCPFLVSGAQSVVQLPWFSYQTQTMLPDRQKMTPALHSHIYLSVDLLALAGESSVRIGDLLTEYTVFCKWIRENGVHPPSPSLHPFTECLVFSKMNTRHYLNGWAGKKGDPYITTVWAAKLAAAETKIKDSSSTRFLASPAVLQT